MSQYCAHEASCRCHIYMPRSGNSFVRTGNERFTTTLKLMNTWTTLLYSANNCKIIGSEIRTLRAFKDSDSTFGARVRKTVGTRSCCIPELLGLKGLKAPCSTAVFVLCPEWHEDCNRFTPDRKAVICTVSIAYRLHAGFQVSKPTPVNMPDSTRKRFGYGQLWPLRPACSQNRTTSISAPFLQRRHGSYCAATCLSKSLCVNYSEKQSPL